MHNDLRGKAVLITGGTAGIGLATGLAFGTQGAHVTLTCRWGSADPSEIEARFAEVGAPPPRILEANVTSAEETNGVLSAMKEAHEQVYALVSCVGFAQLVRSFDDYGFKGLSQSIEHSAWPIASHLMGIRDHFGAWPQYAVAVSSFGAEEYHSNYDFAGASKAVLETLVRYLAHRLFETECRVNAVRPRWVPTASLDATVGEEFVPFAREYGESPMLQSADEVASVVLALCSGLLDGMRGQVINVDHGTHFYDNLMRLHCERDRFLPPENMP